jgi:hypothetical protein
VGADSGFAFGVDAEGVTSSPASTAAAVGDMSMYAMLA